VGLMTDEEFCDGLVRSDFDVQSAFLERYQTVLPDVLRKTCDWLTSQEIEDVVADVLYDLIQNPHKIDLARGSLDGLIYTATYRRAIDLYRKAKADLAGYSVSN